MHKLLQVSGILSSAGPEKSCVNLPVPSGKAKYSSDTDSEPVTIQCAYNPLEPPCGVTACLLKNEPAS